MARRHTGFIGQARLGISSRKLPARQAERLMTFAKELSAQLPEDTRLEILQALREILLNAMEHGAAFNPEQVVEVTAVHTARALCSTCVTLGLAFAANRFIQRP
jgi:anti-sigma regulatory factor (Ser/Thr protein kinase)